MTVTISGTSGIVNDETDLNYTGTLTGSTGVVNIGSGQVYKDASGNVGIGTSSPVYKLDVRGGNPTIRVSRSGTAGQVVSLLFEDGNATLGAGSTTRIASDAGAMSFSTGGTSGADSGGTERARIDSSGNLLVGATSGNGRVHVKGASATSSDHSIYCVNSSAGVSFTVRNDGYINTGLLAVSPYNYSVTGRNAYLDSSGGFGYLASVRAAKTNIENLSNISWIYNLNPVSFNYRKKDEENQFTDEFESEKHYGLIAEEVESVNQELCFYDNDGTLRGVSYDKLTSVLIKAIQEQQATIVSLQDTLTALTTRSSALEERLTALEAANV